MERLQLLASSRLTSDHCQIECHLFRRRLGDRGAIGDGIAPITPFAQDRSPQTGWTRDSVGGCNASSGETKMKRGWASGQESMALHLEHATAYRSAGEIIRRGPHSPTAPTSICSEALSSIIIGGTPSTFREASSASSRSWPSGRKQSLECRGPAPCGSNQRSSGRRPPCVRRCGG